MNQFLKKSAVTALLLILITSCNEDKEIDKLDSSNISTVESFDNRFAETKYNSSTKESKQQNITDREIRIPQTYTEEELKVIDVINKYRNSLGLNTLSKNIPNLFVRDIALDHNLNMIKTQAITHNGFSERANKIADLSNWGIQRRDFRVGVIKEIIAYDFRTPESVLTAWLNSPDHKEAIINNKITHLGLSVTSDSSNGKKYYTVFFVETNAPIRI